MLCLAKCRQGVNSFRGWIYLGQAAKPRSPDPSVFIHCPSTCSLCAPGVDELARLHPLLSVNEIRMCQTLGMRTYCLALWGNCPDLSRWHLIVSWMTSVSRLQEPGPRGHSTCLLACGGELILHKASIHPLQRAFCAEEATKLMDRFLCPKAPAGLWFFPDAGGCVRRGVCVLGWIHPAWTFLCFVSSWSL